MESFVTDLHQKLFKTSVILTESDPRFAAALERWTDIDRKVPAVVVQPANERDVAVLVSQYPPSQCLAMALQLLTYYLVVQVSEAHAAGVPFVPATGGHSQWSTVEDGMVIDMSRYKETMVDPEGHIVAVRGGVLMKELQLALSEEAQFTSRMRGSRYLLTLLTRS